MVRSLRTLFSENSYNVQETVVSIFWYKVKGLPLMSYSAIILGWILYWNSVTSMRNWESSSYIIKFFRFLIIIIPPRSMHVQSNFWFSWHNSSKSKIRMLCWLTILVSRAGKMKRGYKINILSYKSTLAPYFASLRIRNTTRKCHKYH